MSSKPIRSAVLGDSKRGPERDDSSGGSLVSAMNAQRELASSPENSVGFSANLKHASLTDLVQMHCLGGAQCVARITSGEHVGYLYFRGGNIVHAMSASHVGESAALEILGWNTGVFELCNAGWPDSESIQAASPTLLLRAAHARDESNRKHRNLVRLAVPRSEPPPARADASAVSELTSPFNEERAAMPDRHDGGLESRVTLPPTLGPQSGVTRVQAAARVDAHGNVISSRGLGSEELAGVSALSVRLAQLVGESLGLDRLLAVEGSSPSQRTLIVLEKSGSILGMRAPSDADLASVRERYGV